MATAANLAPGPGTSVGTLNIGGDLTISAMAGGAGLLKFELNTIAASDKIVLATGKVLTIGSGALGLSDFNFTDLGSLQNGTYTLIQTDQTISGSLAGDTNGTLGSATIDLQISGDGTDLELVVSGLGGGTPYDTWAARIPDTNQRGRGDDPDGDGFSNGEEFIFGTSPIVADGSLSTSEKSGGDLIIRWKERTSGATYNLLQSATLNNDWVTAIGARLSDDGAAVGDYQPRKATLAIGSGSLFFRVQGAEN